MANIKSAKKKVRVGRRNAKINKSYKSSIKTLLKRYRQNLKDFATNRDEKTLQTLQTLISSLYSRIDKAAKKKVFHINKAARQKSRIVSSLKKIISV
uniref:Ribosomal protein S20 n=1 Tax=Eustigmatophyceae sp. Mont 10/10-1w TaxID=2506145 RepID=A0A3R5U4P3_9STRA|nr:ribosomal protein S20 [Eustigmatophyceae sp. Mont 10/10-1w]QAA11730.1 ribosomal protein S20 [Eustigmatophyceae sp. Mont 10/10-1w]